ncbi:hypothetical protein FCT18_20105 [Lysinibacillus sphaericus]|uniref:Uncharacterized protein n=2 Tax=Lysinibacillus sphaericus TaxID=1421 RepID=A0AAJ4ZVI8_LYSSH|nr:hypothetical protein [Lysinibacillus sphaericus]MED4545724.1 hypothetical protein [Lysinibacillus sphaericus]TKI16713.1 hypothetical protein FCT18_20105 [Lysinibacillus sphaericus]SUV17363.1 Uncharacterised protein [Lysinibacillus sphaericus]
MLFSSSSIRFSKFLILASADAAKANAAAANARAPKTKVFIGNLLINDKYAILLFTSMLGNWYSKSSFAFKPQKERLKYDDGIDTDFYNLESYLSSLLDCYQHIEKDFPYMYEYIVVYLILIEKDKGISYEEWFPEINSDIFKKLREKILIPNSNLAHGGHPIKFLFREVGIEPFFSTDFFEE